MLTDRSVSSLGGFCQPEVHPGTPSESSGFGLGKSRVRPLAVVTMEGNDPLHCCCFSWYKSLQGTQKVITRKAKVVLYNPEHADETYRKYGSSL